MTVNNGKYRYDKVRHDFDCCGPKMYDKDGNFVRQVCVTCLDDVSRCQNA
jgi:hypothetical protein